MSEKVIHSRVAGFGLSDEQLKVALIRGLASTNVDLEFMRTAHLIYGSQLNLLVALSGRVVGGMPRVEAEALFDSAKVSWPQLHERRAFEEWLGFLLKTQLIVEANGHVDIAQVGTDFLKFLLDQRLAHERSG